MNIPAMAEPKKKAFLKRQIEAGDVIRIAGILIFTGLAVWVTILFTRYFSAYTAGGDSSGTFLENLLSGKYVDHLMGAAESLANDLANQYGAYTMLILGFLQFMQVVITAIPAAITSFASGMIYGVWGGVLISMVGTAIGTALTFYLTRLLGRRVLTLFISQKNIDKMEGFIDADTGMFVMLILFIVPSPKDFFPFFVGLTKMKAWKFFLISAIGRIPGMFITSYLGATVAQRNWGLLIGMTIFAVAASVSFVVFNKKLMALLNGMRKKRKAVETHGCASPDK